MPTTPKELPQSILNSIPDGYTMGEGPDGQYYIIPQYLFHDLDQSFRFYRQKYEFNIQSSRPQFHEPDPELETEVVGSGLLFYPANPILSEQERLSVHSEILVLQDCLGISYKDASHRLYMASLEKLKAVDIQCKELATLAANIEESLKHIDGDNSDNLTPDTGKGKEKQTSNN